VRSSISIARLAAPKEIEEQGKIIVAQLEVQLCHDESKPELRQTMAWGQWTRLPAYACAATNASKKIEARHDRVDTDVTSIDPPVVGVLLVVTGT